MKKSKTLMSFSVCYTEADLAPKTLAICECTMNDKGFTTGLPLFKAT